MHRDYSKIRIKYFEGRIYNARVRELVDSGQYNDTGFADAWAEGRFVEVRATSLVEAMRLLQRDYPEDAGFKVTDLIEIPDPYAP
ncbi:hypothetical protein [Minwuia thermotolerans]|uniref:Uncharacterized protein n=1 Tax=Minwuia thermotolerans TaxID=2056226 RepID=A0A2M9FW56_9PROT|nr:hypothetical protein [Minwuia thermotolerans]PJK27692.1 hypothetical protein CVT23_20995 [Minwuia thermotolerans]